MIRAEPVNVRYAGAGLSADATPLLSLTLLGFPGMSPQCPLLGENEKRDARCEPVNQGYGRVPDLQQPRSRDRIRGATTVAVQEDVKSAASTRAAA